MPNPDENPGHTALLNDLRKLYKDAQNYMFDDEKSEFEKPKEELMDRLNDISCKAEMGKYKQ